MPERSDGNPGVKIIYLLYFVYLEILPKLIVLSKIKLSSIMIEIEFVSYKKFTNQIEVNDIVDVLKENKIEFQIQNSSLPNLFITNNELNNEFKLMLRKDDFEKVDQLLTGIAEKQIATISNDYYLFEFSDDELLDIIKNKDEWGIFDYTLAKKILTVHGVELTKNILLSVNEKRIKELGEEKRDIKMVLFGFVFTLISYSILFKSEFISFSLLATGVGSVFGYILNYQEITLPNGIRKLVYTKTYRLSGKIILLLNFAMIVIILIRFFYLNV